MDDNILKDKLREFASLEAPYSDIQDVAMALARDLNKDKELEIAEILLLYYNNEFNINEAQRYILENLNEV